MITSSLRRLMLLFGLAAVIGLLSACSESRSEGQGGPPVSEGAPAGIVFADVTEQAGLGAFRHDNGQFGAKYYPEQMGAGGGFIDYDGDGWLDILLVGGGVWPGKSNRDVQALWLYRNKGDGTFQDVTSETGLADLRTYSIGLAVADYDNDGDQDFYLTTLGRNLLYRNEGGHFTEVGRESGVADQEIWSSSAAFFDADRDGWLDLYVANYVDWTPENDVWCSVDGQTKAYCRPASYHGVQSVFYHNNGDGTFSNRTKEAGFWGALGKSLGVAELDFNNDGWSDLAVVNDGEGNLLYQNDGDGTFTEIAEQAGTAYDENGAARAGMGVDAGVVDTTGEVTIFVGNFSGEMIGVYRHLGNGLFVDRAAVSKIGLPSFPTLTFGLFLFDPDLDGDLDLLAANGHVYPEPGRLPSGTEYRQVQQLFLNDGTGTFEEANPRLSGVWAEKLVARGAAYADYDRDGDLDILLTENNGPAHLWRNDLQGGSYLRIHLEGRESSRDALGARILARVGERTMERRLRTGSSYLSSLEKAATFGLNGADQVDELTIYWPSGRVDRFTNVAARQDIHILEGEGTYTAEDVPT